ncbi:MAG: diaminopimelate decarboxylase, partial [Gammaproteobacteria bacterium]
MNPFLRKDGHLHVEELPLATLAREYGTPLFVYSRAALEAAWREFDEALAARPHLICYAVKANSNLAVLDTLARLGSGFDIVSEGELRRVLAAGGRADRTVFSGVGKSASEMAFALEQGIRCFNVESVSELEHLADVAAAHGIVAPVSLRINPDVDARTHPYISTGLRENKFGIGMNDALGAYRRAAELEHLSVDGIDCHIGSQLVEIDPYREAV